MARLTFWEDHHEFEYAPFPSRLNHRLRYQPTIQYVERGRETGDPPLVFPGSQPPIPSSSSTRPMIWWA